jgi:hypothetical protein
MALPDQDSVAHRRSGFIFAPFFMSSGASEVLSLSELEEPPS